MATKKKANPATKAAPKKTAPAGAPNQFSRSALTGLRQAAASLAKVSKRANAKKFFTQAEVLALQSMIAEGNAKLDEFLRIVPKAPDPEIGI